MTPQARTLEELEHLYWELQKGTTAFKTALMEIATGKNKQGHKVDFFQEIARKVLEESGQTF